MSTKSIGKPIRNKQEYILDATDRPLGRLASEIAHILQGKNKPDYVPHLPGANVVVVKNAAQVKMSGSKRQKIYYHHTGYIGHLKELTYEQLFAKDPRKVIEYAVNRMLPKNKLRQRWLNRLKIEV